MVGIHLLGEWFDCGADADTFGDAQSLRALCIELTAAAGLSIVGERFHHFEPGGVTGTLLLAESHLAIHTWPEYGFASVDVFVCNFKSDNTAKAHQLFDALRAALRPASVQEQTIQRGAPGQVRRAA